MIVEGGRMTRMTGCWRTSDGRETPLAILIQVLFPFTVAGMGMVAAGFVFDYVDNWHVFNEINEIIIMIPALLGLKGNLEMTLAARLSTASNMGRLDSMESASRLILSNLALLQCQGVVLGCLVALGAVLVGVCTEGPLPIQLDHALVLLSSSMLTASIASAGLGAITALVIIVARKLRINPDNVATPIVGALGDITSLSLLAYLVSFLHNEVVEERYTAHVVIGCYALVPLLCGYIAWKNMDTKPVMVGGWVPVLMAMAISSGAGIILERAAGNFDILTQFQTVFNGVGGNLAAIQASRISTTLHSSENLTSEILDAEKSKASASETKGSLTLTTLSTVRTEYTSSSTLASNRTSLSSLNSFILPSNKSIHSLPTNRTSISSLPTRTSSNDLTPTRRSHSILGMEHLNLNELDSRTPNSGARTSSNCLTPTRRSHSLLPDRRKTNPILDEARRIDSTTLPSISSSSSIGDGPSIRRHASSIFAKDNPSSISHCNAVDPADSLHPREFFCCGGSSHSSTARILLLLVLPGHSLFLYMFVLLDNGDKTPTTLFVALYLLATLVQVTILLQVTHLLVHWFWSRGTDPDSSAIPYLTALGDLLGVSLLTATCYLLKFAEDDYVLNDYGNITTQATIHLHNSTLRHNLL